MEILMTSPNLGIITLLMLAVMIFFQVIIHNSQEKKRFRKLEEQLRKQEEMIEKLSEKIG
jgi:hypothetical protein